MLFRSGVELQAEKPDGVTYSYTTEKAYGNEAGSLKIVTNAIAQTTLKFDAQGMTYSDTDYVVFYMYSSKAINNAILFEYRVGTFLNSGAWTKVIVPATQFFASPYRFRFYQYTGTAEQVTLYMSKVKLYSASEVRNLTVDNGEYTLGDTTFTDTPYLSTGTTHKNNSVWTIEGVAGGTCYSVTPFYLEIGRAHV